MDSATTTWGSFYGPTLFVLGSTGHPVGLGGTNLTNVLYPIKCGARFSRTRGSIDLQLSFLASHEIGVLFVGKILPFPLLLRHRRKPAPELRDRPPFVQYARLDVLWGAHRGKETTHDYSSQERRNVRLSTFVADSVSCFFLPSSSRRYDNDKNNNEDKNRLPYEVTKNKNPIIRRYLFGWNLVVSVWTMYLYCTFCGSSLDYTTFTDYLAVSTRVHPAYSPTRHTS